MSNEQQHYLQQVAQMRQQRAQQEYQQHVQQVQADYYENLAQRQEIERQATTATDEHTREWLREQWNMYDAGVQEAEHAYQALMPAQRPQDPPAWREWALRNRAFYDRYGERAKQAVQAAHGYITRPKNPRETNPDRRGMGLQPWTPAYFDALESLLQTHGRLVGLQYDSKDKALTPDEAAEASGLLARDYNRAVVDLRNQGRLGQDD